tara:strand:+ start:758 stop:1126 length:369 start_codon:yes stop_codon:yes gene_type:complete
MENITLFERLFTPLRTSPQEKPNTYWVGEHYDRLHPAIRGWVDTVEDFLGLETIVEGVDLHGRLAELRGQPIYTGKDPKDVQLHVRTTDPTIYDGQSIDFPVPEFRGLVLQVKVNPCPYLPN